MQSDTLTYFLKLRKIEKTFRNNTTLISESVNSLRTGKLRLRSALTVLLTFSNQMIMLELSNTEQGGNHDDVSWLLQNVYVSTQQLEWPWFLKRSLNCFIGVRNFASKQRWTRGVHQGQKWLWCTFFVQSLMEVCRDRSVFGLINLGTQEMSKWSREQSTSRQ